MPCVDTAASIGYAGGMPPTRRKTGEVRITGLDPEEEMTIKLAAVRTGKTIRDWALDHAKADVRTTRMVVISGDEK